MVLLWWVWRGGDPGAIIRPGNPPCHLSVGSSRVYGWGAVEFSVGLGPLPATARLYPLGPPARMIFRTLSTSLFLLGVLILCDLAPFWWRGNGMEHQTAEQQRAALEVLERLPTSCLDNPIQYLLTRHYYVVSVTPLPECHSTRVVIDLSTVFGIPTQRIIRDCFALNCLGRGSS